MRDSKNLPHPKTRKRHARLQYLSQVLDELYTLVSTTDLRSSRKHCDALADEITPLVEQLHRTVERSLPIEIRMARMRAFFTDKREVQRSLRAFLAQRKRRAA